VLAGEARSAILARCGRRFFDVITDYGMPVVDWTGVNRDGSPPNKKPAGGGF